MDNEQIREEIEGIRDWLYDIERKLDREDEAMGLIRKIPQIWMKPYNGGRPDWPHWVIVQFRSAGTQLRMADNVPWDQWDRRYGWSVRSYCEVHLD